MTDRTWALVKDGIVENMVVWDGETEWSPEGYTIVETTDLEVSPGPGWSYEGGVFTSPPSPDPVPVVEEEAPAVV